MILCKSLSYYVRYVYALIYVTPKSAHVKLCSKIRISQLCGCLAVGFAVQMSFRCVKPKHEKLLYICILITCMKNNSSVNRRTFQKRIIFI